MRISNWFTASRLLSAQGAYLVTPGTPAIDGILNDMTHTTGKQIR